MFYNRFFVLPVLMFSSVLLNTIHARPSPQDPNQLETKVIENGGSPGQHHRQVHHHGGAQTHVHQLPAQGGETITAGGAPVTHVHHISGDPTTHVYHTGEAPTTHVHKFTVDGNAGNNNGGSVVEKTSSDKTDNTVKTISLSAITDPTVPGSVKVQEIAQALNVPKCQKGVVNGVASKAKDILNKAAGGLSQVLAKLTKKGSLLGPVGAIVGTLVRGTDNIFENTISGANYGVNDIVCGVEGVVKAAGDLLAHGNVPKDVKIAAETILKSAASTVKDGVGGVVFGVKGALTDIKDLAGGLLNKKKKE